MSQPAGPRPPGTLVTGDAVPLDLRLAALPSRAVARLVDALAQGGLLLGLVLLVTLTAGAASDAVSAALGILVLVLVLLAYPITLETLLRGRTPGKAAMGLRVVRDDGGPIGFRQALVRGLAVLVDLPTVFTVSVVCMLLHPRGKRLGDLLAGTVVLQERVAASGGAVAVMPPPLEGWARTLELSGLPDDLALQVRSFVSRAGELTPQAREDLGGRLVAAVQSVTAPPPPPGTPGWAYLSAVLAERRRRDSQRLAGPAARPQQTQPPAAPPVGTGGAPAHGAPPEDPPPPGPFALPS